ncbi:MAG: PilZ domain-containing protein [Spirochaetales bacterium]|nr:PilZ domain-containing protein [Spirochaetales bacterium]
MNDICRDSSPQAKHQDTGPPQAIAAEKKIRRKHLINKLNHHHFAVKPVTLVFSSEEYTQELEYEGFVEPCTDTDVRIRVAKSEDLPILRNCALSYIQLKTGSGLFRLYPSGLTIKDDIFTVDLPSFGEQMVSTASAYVPAKDLQARVYQNSVELLGTIERFSSRSFLFICDNDDNAHQLINGDTPAHVLIQNNDGPVFSGDCAIAPAHTGSRTFKLTPDLENVNRFPAKEYRSARIILDNLPLLSFHHPMSGMYMEFRIHDISGTGFRISNQHAILFPGLKIHDALITFPDGTKLRCLIQVIHTRYEMEESSVGMGILDILPQDHIKLLAMLHQARDPYAFLCKKINLHQLMEFFFDSGFIYPAKYAYLQKYKKEILLLYDKLYNSENDIARHFIYQKGNSILGHLAMMRFSEKGWLIHHHAAALEGGMNAGIHVLNQATSFITDSYRFHRMNLNFILCFFRPDNKFPQRVFGSLVPKINDRQQCSVDPFAYIHLPAEEIPADDGAGWTLSDPEPHDFQVLTKYYHAQSGGLLLEAMDILPHQSQNGTIKKAFAEAGIERDIQLKTLKNNGSPAAFFILNTSDPGLNMSDLTNNLMIIIINENMLSRQRLLHAAHHMCATAHSAHSPLLVYPEDAARRLDLKAEKTYEFWIIRSSLSDIYHEHVESLFRGSIKNLSTPEGGTP